MADKTLVMAVHAHQPVGNFEEALKSTTEESYQPFLENFAQSDSGTLSYHASGILLRWWQEHSPEMIDLIGTLVDERRLELLAGGFFEPILPLLPRDDRRRQIELHQNYLQSMFDVEARGLWLAEQVWYPDLVDDLTDTGIEYLAVDENHFRAAGWDPSNLHGYYQTNYNGKSLGIFPINKRLRHSIPFQSVETITETLNELPGLVQTMAGNAEKFGSWPDTEEWVYEKGWIDNFFDTAGEDFRLTSMESIYDSHEPEGTVYLPSASHEEMEKWALPEDRKHQFIQQKANRESSGRDSFLRGGHFHNFLVKYEESNRLHKRMVWLSNRWREEHPDDAPPRGLLASQCNDAYWHGVSGGLVLPHLRNALWRRLGQAHREFFVEERTLTRQDYNGDGVREILLETPEQFMVIDPTQLGCVVDWHHFSTNKNLIDTLTRRWPAYLSEPSDPEKEPEEDSEQESSVPESWLKEWAKDPMPRRAFQPVSVTPDASPKQFQTNQAVEWLRANHNLHSVRIQERSAEFRIKEPIEQIRYQFADRGGSWSAKGYKSDGAPAVMFSFGMHSPDNQWCWLEADGEKYSLTERHSLDTDQLTLIDRISGSTMILKIPRTKRTVSYPIESVSRSDTGVDKIFQGVCVVIVGTGDFIELGWALET